MTEITPSEFTRLADHFYKSRGIVSDINRIALDSHLINYFSSNQEDIKKKFKIAFCSVVLNPPYWQYAKEMIEGAKQLFLPGHDIDFFLWTDMPETTNYGATIIPTEGTDWPLPTLMRYHLYLQQEEKLKEYDYIFHCDVDMRFVNIVGDEILGESLTVAPHPGYVTRKEIWPPYEPNEKSASFIKRPGIVTLMEGKPRFMPFYAAGGFQGGKTEDFIEAMKGIRKLIDKDMDNNYIPIWNDETAWNKYIFDILPTEKLNKSIFLTPSYVYPDSLIKEYYEKIWGCSYFPRIITLTKPFSMAPGGGEQVKKMIENL